MAQLNNLIVTGSSRFLNTINGNAETAEKVNHDLTIQINSGSTEGTNKFTFNGSSTKTVNITASNVGAATSSHTHGNIQSSGTLQTDDITIASGDKLVVTDSSNSAKVARTSVSFDGSTATKCLTQKGTWESFTNNAGTITGSGTSGYIAKWNGGSSITNGPAFGTATTTFLRNDGSWVAPTGAVASVAGKTGTVTLSASDVGALASTTKYAKSASVGGPASEVALNSFGSLFTGNILVTNNNTTDNKVYNGSDFSLASSTSADSNQGRTDLYIGNSLHSGHIVLNTGPDSFTSGLDREVVIHPPMTGAITEPAMIELTLPSTSGTLLNNNYSLAAGESFGGAAVAAAKLKNDVTVGTSYNPVYFYQGLPVAGKYSFDSGNIAAKGTTTITGIQRGLIIISRGTAGAGVYFIDHWYGVATAVNNANFTVTCSNGTATLKNNHASLQATYFAIYYKQ